MTKRSWILIAILALAACSREAAWKNPDLPPGQESADETACRHSAEEDMGRVSRTDPLYADPGLEKFDSPMQMVDRSEVRQHYAELVAQCMESRGYRAAN